MCIRDRCKYVVSIIQHERLNPKLEPRCLSICLLCIPCLQFRRCSKAFSAGRPTSNCLSTIMSPNNDLLITSCTHEMLCIMLSELQSSHVLCVLGEKSSNLLSTSELMAWFSELVKNALHLRTRKQSAHPSYDRTNSTGFLFQIFTSEAFTRKSFFGRLMRHDPYVVYHFAKRIGKQNIHQVLVICLLNKS
eukprot:TRINITY_DN1789_c0_g1_i5.p1 TRINITY_DN1789_c0_g1~~TRINITY_DN1789_c0_g1_i5.p1  ORF type:complete len:211 (+),score=5.83 TRINITY_DN1789_c0_g1_i5:61-633(+)